MDKSFYFGNASWVGAADRTSETFSVLRGHYFAKEQDSVKLNILGLGFFKCYINGNCINPDTFLPLSSDFEATCDPVDEVLTNHRMYVCQFDITPYTKDGDNVIAVHFGGGWYTFECRCFGLPKAIYSIEVQSDNGTNHFVSDENCRIKRSFIEKYGFTTHEVHNYTDWEDCFGCDFDDSTWDNAVLTESVDTDYLVTSCPIDKHIKTLDVKKMGEGVKGGIVYDCGQNTTGYPVIEINAKKGETVCVYLSEDTSPDTNIDHKKFHGQYFKIISDGKKRYITPDFTWFGFRCFEIVGDATPIGVKVVYADVSGMSTFNCDNETLNWIYQTFLHTMHTNMHTGHPSDCPHIERRGYTGDGQLTCNAVLTTMDARAFYEKWLADISDGQDKLTGHIQYTAPYIKSGGGPGGWGCAIVEVAYQLYKHYGDTKILEKYYPNMLRYIDYLEAHSDYGLVTSDKEGEWCLGDWCGPIILYPDKDITSHNQQVFLPASYVNTYFMVKSLITMRKIAGIIGKDEDISVFDKKINYRKGAINSAYFNSFDSNFVMNIQGANAFGVDLGIGDESTYKNMVKYYQKLGHYDTGIFATDILTKLLFEKGDELLALKLLTNDGDQGFEHWRKNGATTFHEYWDSNRSRSHNHPMFGAVVTYFFEHLLGIRQEDDSCAYQSVVISPKAISEFGKMQGSITCPNGVISVNYQTEDGKTKFNIQIPKGTKAVFSIPSFSKELHEGENEFFVEE